MMSVAERWADEFLPQMREAAGAAIEPVAAATELTVVVPTLNERDNVPLLVDQLNRVLAGISWEVIFIVERRAFEGSMRSLSGQGFKILLDLFASAPQPLAFAEVPLIFRQRVHGESKLDTLVAWEYLMLLLQKLVGPAVPVRFLLFSLIGGLGVVTHLVTLWVIVFALGAAFAVAQGVATAVAMTGNFLLNNLFTYRDRRLHGWRLVGGLLTFYAICSAG